MFDYNSILNLPDRVILNSRITKAFFFKNFVLKSSEKKLLNQSILHMNWLARISQKSANIPKVLNDKWAFEEVQVMVCHVALMDGIEKDIIELFQNHIPYHILLFVEDGNEFLINVSQKRVNLNDRNKRTIEGHFMTSKFSKLYTAESSSDFFNSISFDKLDKTNLETLFKSYLSGVVQEQSARITGKFSIRSQSRTEEDMKLLLQIEEIEQEVTSLNAMMKKAIQLNEKVELNVKIQRKVKEIETIKNELSQ